MSAHLSPVVAAQHRSFPGFNALRSIDLKALGAYGSPLLVLDDFRVQGLPFSPHPHAGFAAVTYVFEDSPGALRSRASTGVDLVVGPGGVVWGHTGTGIVHEEAPAERGRELHGLQLFVNLSAKNKLSAPLVHSLEAGEVAEWRSDDGDRARVVVGGYGGVSSPLVPAEPFTMLDVELRHEFSYVTEDAQGTVVYVLRGSVLAGAAGQVQEVGGGQAVALLGGGARLTLRAVHPAHLLVLSGSVIDEPVVEEGPFIMNDRSQLAAAAARYRSGAMGGLSPLGNT
jgi:hypothetical protein